MSIVFYSCFTLKWFAILIGRSVAYVVEVTGEAAINGRPLLLRGVPFRKASTRCYPGPGIDASDVRYRPRRSYDTRRHHLGRASVKTKNYVIVKKLYCVIFFFFKSYIFNINLLNNNKCINI